jgi:hypothetical protein
LITYHLLRFSLSSLNYGRWEIVFDHVDDLQYRVQLRRELRSPLESALGTAGEVVGHQDLLQVKPSS